MKPYKDRPGSLHSGVVLDISTMTVLNHQEEWRNSLHSESAGITRLMKPRISLASALPGVPMNRRLQHLLLFSASSVHDLWSEFSFSSTSYTFDQVWYIIFIWADSLHKLTDLLSKHLKWVIYFGQVGTKWVDLSVHVWDHIQFHLLHHIQNTLESNCLITHWEASGLSTHTKRKVFSWKEFLWG